MLTNTSAHAHLYYKKNMRVGLIFLVTPDLTYQACAKSPASPVHHACVGSPRDVVLSYCRTLKAIRLGHF